MSMQLQNQTRTTLQRSVTPVQTGFLQRQCACGQHTIAGEECAECRQKSEEMIQRTSVSSAPASTVPPVVYEVLSSSGQPLDTATRGFMEPRFGHNFSGVRVHTDARAAESARAVNALAYTVGRDIVFGTGRYTQGTKEGMKLMAHELTHTVQQSTGIQRGPDKLEITDSGDIAEQEAELTAQSIMRGRLSSPITNDSLKIARQDSTTTSESPLIVHMCSKDLESSPIGTHTFFRVGGSGPGNPTYSLEPQDNRPLSFIDGETLHSGCWQGVPVPDFPEDFNAATARCEPTAISLSCLQSQFATYPIGRYCTYGPNSNTFVGYIARQCGLSNPDPAGWNPGIDGNPPAAGTFAPSPNWTALLGCEFESCPILAPDQSNPGEDGNASA